MRKYLRRAYHDILDNRFLHFVTFITITFSIFIVSTCALFFVNVDHVISNWKKGIRIMAYLDRKTPETEIATLRKTLLSIKGIRDVIYIDRNDALKELRKQMDKLDSLFENLKENPLPDAFSIRMDQSIKAYNQIEALAIQIRKIPQIEDLEYGQQWLGKFINSLSLLKFSGLAMCSCFLIVSGFIIANTIRLAIYSRREELDIMCLFGADEVFIKAPFYIEGLVQGACGALMGIVMLYLIYYYMTSASQNQFGVISYLSAVQFLPLNVSLSVVFCSTFVGWLGCYWSLKQFLKV